MTTESVPTLALYCEHPDWIQESVSSHPDMASGWRAGQATRNDELRERTGLLVSELAAGGLPTQPDAPQPLLLDQLLRGESA